MAGWGSRRFAPIIHLAGLGWSWSHINQVSCALRFFFGVTLGRPEAFDRIISAKEPQKLPVVRCVQGLCFCALPDGAARYDPASARPHSCRGGRQNDKETRGPPSPIYIVHGPRARGLLIVEREDLYMASETAARSVPWYRESTKDHWYARWAAWLGWTLDAFDFTVFLLIIKPIADEFRVPTTKVAIVLGSRAYSRQRAHRQRGGPYVGKLIRLSAETQQALRHSLFSPAGGPAKAGALEANSTCVALRLCLKLVNQRP
jgi:hypothetical protein